MKILFNRPKDWVDVERLVAIRSDFDRAYVQTALTEILGDDDERQPKWAALLNLVDGT